MKIYIYNGVHYTANSKDAVLRKNGLIINGDNLKLVKKVSVNKKYQKFKRALLSQQP